MFSLFAEDAVPNAANQITKTAEESGLALKHSFENAWAQIVDFTPRVLAAVIVLVAGYFIAKLVARAITLGLGARVKRRWLRYRWVVVFLVLCRRSVVGFFRGRG